MNREPVNPDDPQMTAYALGELSAAESAEFEARLQLSPVARRELAEMKETPRRGPARRVADRM
jgi:anti-sigma factor RsiW